MTDRLILPPVLGLILAGGLGRRMGQADKGRLELEAGRSLFDEVIARLAPQCSALALSANGDPGRFADLGLPVLADPLPGHPGPLAGLLAGMEFAAAEGFELVLSAAADTPFLPRDLHARLALARESSGQSIALAATPAESPGGKPQRQPVFGLWPVELRADLRRALEAGVGKVGQWAGKHGVALAEFDTAPIDPFLNLNRPEDLEAARRIWARRP